MLPAYFISDLHLGCQHAKAAPDYAQRAAERLRSWCGQASHVILVGDIFEFWMEYKYYIPSAHWEFLEALSALTRSGVQVHALAGNHDFALGKFFEKTLGIAVHRRLILELQGKRVLFLHGDGLARSDWPYRLARRVIDSPVNQFLFRLLPADWGWELARWVGQTSRMANEDREAPAEEYAAACRRLLREYQADMVVHGHTHRGGVWEWEEGTQVNCGSWLFDLNYVRYQNGEVRLLSDL